MIKPKSELVEWFYKHGYTCIQDTGMTWKELGKKFGFQSSDGARKHFKKNYYPSLEQYCLDRGIDPSDVQSALYVGRDKAEGKDYFNLWLKIKEEGIKIKDEISDFIDSFNFDIPVREYSPVECEQEDEILLILIADQHIGMDCKGSLFGYVWGEQEYFSRLALLLDKVSQKIANMPNLGEIHVFLLGDKSDGLDKKTTRRSAHILPQNMTSREMFKTCVEGDLFLIDNLTVITKFSKKIKVHQLTNSNHGGIIDYSSAYTVKSITELKYPGLVEVSIADKFINHTVINNDFIMFSHGYDEEFVKDRNKMTLHLNEGWEKKLRNYIDVNDGMKYNRRFLLRGDLHQFSLDSLSNVEDILVPSFAPPSAYVQNNFGTTYPGGCLLSTLSTDSFSIRRFDFSK